MDESPRCTFWSFSWFLGIPTTGNFALDVIRAATVSGTVAEIGGGKFANGAVSGAFAAAVGNMTSGGAEGDVEDYFEHFTETELGADPVPSEFTAEGRAALDDVLKSPVGGKIARHVNRTGEKIKVALSVDADMAFSVIDGYVYYTPDVNAYLAAKPHSVPQTLGSLLAHEVGHVVVASRGMSPPREEIYVTRHFENPECSLGVPTISQETFVDQEKDHEIESSSSSLTVGRHLVAYVCK